MSLKKNSSSLNSKYHQNYTSISDFEKDFKFQSEAIITSIKASVFKFSSLYPVVIYDKKNLGKKPRLICIPTVRDRLVQQMIIGYLNIHAQDDLQAFKSSDFSMRKTHITDERGAIAARNKAKQLRENYPFVLKTDISSFFDNIDRTLLIKSIRESLSIDIASLLESVIKCDPFIPSKYKNFQRDLIRNKLGKGVRQGMPLSSLLASFYLAEFDETLRKEKIMHVRYADDLIFFLNSQEECYKIFERVKKILFDLKLSVPSLEDNTKSQIVRPYGDISFLGLDLRYINKMYDWYIPPHVYKNIEENLNDLSNIDKNIRDNLTFLKTIKKMDQIIDGYKYCFKDTNPKDLKDFENRIISMRTNCIAQLFENIGIDYSRIPQHYRYYLLGKL